MNAGIEREVEGPPAFVIQHADTVRIGERIACQDHTARIVVDIEDRPDCTRLYLDGGHVRSFRKGYHQNLIRVYRRIWVGMPATATNLGDCIPYTVTGFSKNGGVIWAVRNRVIAKDDIGEAYLFDIEQGSKPEKFTRRKGMIYRSAGHGTYGLTLGQRVYYVDTLDR